MFLALFKCLWLRKMGKLRTCVQLHEQQIEEIRDWTERQLKVVLFMGDLALKLRPAHSFERCLRVSCASFLQTKQFNYDNFEFDDSDCYSLMRSLFGCGQTTTKRSAKNKKKKNDFSLFHFSLFRRLLPISETSQCNRSLLAANNERFPFHLAFDFVSFKVENVKRDLTSTCSTRWMEEQKSSFVIAHIDVYNDDKIRSKWIQ